MQVVILCGGKGTRLKGHFKDIPKPLVEVGGKPILWHIVKMYRYYGFKDFIFCLGYKAELVKKFFKKQKEKDLNIKFVDTGLDTNTGGRIKKIKDYISEDTFFATYGDGLSDLDLHGLLKFHQENNKIATITCVKPRSPFGIAQINSQGLIVGFKEKPSLNQWVNGGFFVFNKAIFDYLREGDILEKDSFERLIRKNQLVGYKFNGFWECMDTYKDHLTLNELWAKGNPPWAKWLKGARI
jgi:glucose-1-phosphate cytidylyltransferase